MATRRMAAVLAADVAGFAAMTEQDEEGTTARIRALRRDVVQPALFAHQGRLVRTTGDGFLAEFSNSLNAVQSALAIQDQLASTQPSQEGVRLRIGIDFGGVIVEHDGEIFGEAVNIAARLEQIAEPGGVCVTSVVHGELADKEGRLFHPIGDQKLKNIQKPVAVYATKSKHGAIRSSIHERLLPDKPSIAVLPFENLTGDPEQEYFADGMVEELITGLSRSKWLFVIARNSSFTFKDRVVDVTEVGRELGVRYLLKGSVRRAANRVRVACRLIDADSRLLVWADRFEGSMDEIFELQDRVTLAALGQLSPKLEAAEIKKSVHKHWASLNGYDFYLRAKASLHLGSRKGYEQALPLFYKAIEVDPEFALSYGWAAVCYSLQRQHQWIGSPDQVLEGAGLARKALRLGADEPVALATGGFALAYLGRDLDGGAAAIDEATSRSPSLALAWHCSGWVRLYLGQPELAIEHLGRSMRLDPVDPHAAQCSAATAMAHLLAGRFGHAAASARKLISDLPDFKFALRIFVAGSALCGNLEDAKWALAHIRAIDPEFRISDVLEQFPLRRPEDRALYTEGLRLAGLPQ